MKNLKPSMREKKRYLLVKLSQVRSGSSESQTKGKNLRTNIEKAILEFIGVLGMSKACLNFIKINSDSAIISVNREGVDSVKASLVVYPDKMEVLKVSGTLRGLRKGK